jgi:hypothetical protein
MNPIKEECYIPPPPSPIWKCAAELVKAAVAADIPNEFFRRNAFFGDNAGSAESVFGAEQNINLVN